MGSFREEAQLRSALERIQELRHDVLPRLPIAPNQPFNMDLQDWLSLRSMLDSAETVTLAALYRQESRGAHQREDFPDQDPAWEENQVLSLEGDSLTIRRVPVVKAEVEGVAI